MKTKTINIYSFKELDERAKENAMQYMRENWGLADQYTSEAMDTIQKGLAAFNAELKNWSICFTENWRSSYQIDLNENDAELSGLRLRKHILNHFYSNLFRGKNYGELIKGPNGKYRYKRYSKVILVETDCPFTGVCYDYSFLEPIRKFLKNPTDSITWKELLTECVEEVISDVGNEIEAQNTEEAISDLCEANQYEFDEKGNLI